MTPSTRRAQLEFIFNGAAVQRFHTTPPIRPQTDGARSFGVAWLCWMLTEGHARQELIMAALGHDLAEQFTGDLPAMIKRQATIGIQLDALEEEQRSKAGLEFALTEDEQKVLDLADALEGMMFCVQERRLGNREAERWYGRWRAWTDKGLRLLTPACNELIQIIDTLMTEAVL